MQKKIPVFHGIAPFEIESGGYFKWTKSFKYFGEELVEIAKKKKIVAITAAMPNGTGLDTFSKNIRQVSMGIAEQHAVTLAEDLLKWFGALFAVYSLYKELMIRYFMM